MKLNHYRFRELLDLKKEQNKDFTTEYLYLQIGGENSGIKLETLKAYRKGNIKEPSFDALILIANVLECDVFELIENGEYYKNQLNSFPNLPIFLTKISLKSNYVGAGSSGLLNEDEILKELYIDTNQIAKKFRNHHINGVQVIGDSMFPYVNQGDIILYIDRPNNYPNIDGKYIISINGNIQVKNISFKTNGSIIISSENKNYESEIIENESQEMDNFSIIGIIVGRLLRN